MRPASNPVVGDPAFHIRALELTDAEAWVEFAPLPEVKQHNSSTVTVIDDLHMSKPCAFRACIRMKFLFTA